MSSMSMQKAKRDLKKSNESTGVIQPDKKWLKEVGTYGILYTYGIL